MIVGLALLVVSGCDKLPWGSKRPAEQTATAALTTVQSPVSPGRPQVLPQDIVASVNAVSISTADVELRIQELKVLTENLGQPWTPLTAEQQEAVLDELVNTELMSQDAVVRGLGRSLETQQQWEYLRRQFFAQQWLKWNQERLDVTPQDVDSYYEENKAGFRVPARLRLRQLVVSSEDQAKRALAQLHGGTSDFANLAQQISLGSTAAQGGLLPKWIMREQEKTLLYATEEEAGTAGVMNLDPVLEAAAFAIDQVNGISNYVKGADNQYHIFQLVERQDEHQRDKGEVWDDIKGYLSVQKLQGSLDALRKNATIERFPDRLERVSP